MRTVFSASTLIRSLAGTALLVLAVGTSYAGPIKAYFLGYDGGVAAVQTSILGSDARFDLAGSSNNGGSFAVPTLATLLQYDSVLLWTNYTSSNNILLGNTLADYVDAGGHLVMATFVGQEIAGQGRIFTSGYSPFVNRDGDAYTSACLGAYDATNPIMAGVGSICASTFRGDWFPGLDVGATLVASWSDGKPFVGENAAGNVIDISLFPNVAEFGHATGDYALLFRNALADSTGHSVPAPGPLLLLGFGLFGLRFSRKRLRA